MRIFKKYVAVVLLAVFVFIGLNCGAGYAEQAAAVLKITQQPKDQTVPAGQKATVSVKAVGDGLSYQWMIRDPGDADFIESSVKLSSYTVEMNSARNGRQVYCVVSDAKGRSVQSNVVSINMAQLPKIVTQPVNATAPSGEKVTFAVKASGEGLTYAWMLWDPGDTQWFESSNRQSTYSTVMDASKNGRRVYCVVTDKYGQSVQSETVTMTMAAALEIKKQPSDVTVVAGQKAVVIIEAKGENLKYQWMYRDFNSTEFLASSIQSATYTTEMNEKRDGRQLYCVITDGYNQSVTSEKVTLHMAKVPQILEQPKDITVIKGETAEVSVNADGEGLSFKWWIQDPDDPKWYESTVQGNSYEIEMEESRDGRKAYCVVTDKYGQTVESKTATLKMAPVPKITQQPQNVSVYEGERAVLSIAAEGEGLSYQWMIWKPESSKFAASSVRTSSYSTEMNAERNGRQLCCVVTDQYGQSVQSETVTISMLAEPQPVQADQLLAGDKVYFGRYEQDGNAENGTEAIEWTVLEKLGDYALLSSKSVLDCIKYNDEHVDTTWADSAMRRWLNSEFYNQAFNGDEQAAIQMVVLDNPDESFNEGGPHTVDRVYVLSLSEFNKYASELSPRLGYPTAYAQAQGVSGDPCSWWLRSPGSSQNSVVTVDEKGIPVHTRTVVGINVGVRPVVLVDMRAGQLLTDGTDVGMVTGTVAAGTDDETSANVPADVVPVEPNYFEDMFFEIEAIHNMPDEENPYGNGCNHNGEPVFWILEAYAQPESEGFGEVIQVVDCSWLDQMTDLVKDNTDHYSLKPYWDMAQAGITATYNEIWYHWPDDATEFQAETRIICLPDDPSLEGPQHVVLYANGDRVTVEFNLIYEGDYVNGNGWDISDVRYVFGSAEDDSTAAADAEQPVETVTVQDEPGFVVEDIITPVNGDIIKAGEDLKVEWTGFEGINCCFLNLYSKTDAGAFVWGSKELYEGERTAVIPADVLLPGEYILRLSAWSGYGTGSSIEEFNLEVQFKVEFGESLTQADFSYLNAEGGALNADEEEFELHDDLPVMDEMLVVPPVYVDEQIDDAANSSTLLVINENSLWTESEFYFDLGGDGSRETISVYQSDEMEAYYTKYMLRVCDENGRTQDEIELIEHSSGPDGEAVDVIVRVAHIGNSMIYVESMIQLDGTEINYMLFHWNGSSLVLEKHLRNPGYSDGEGMIDELTGEELYYYDYETIYINPYSGCIDALQGEFAAYGLLFKMQDYAFYHPALPVEYSEMKSSIESAVIKDENMLYLGNRTDIPIRNSAIQSPSVFLPGINDMAASSFNTELTGDVVSQVHIEGGKVNIRTGPGLDYSSVGSLKEGRVVDYLGKTSTDSRGVDWYYISFEDKIGWVSSKYGKLKTGTYASQSVIMPTANPISNPINLEYEPVHGNVYVNNSDVELIEFTNEAYIEEFGNEFMANTGFDWNNPYKTIVSRGGSDPEKAVVIGAEMFGKVLYIENQVGGWFALTAPRDGDYVFTVLSPNLSSSSFNMEVSVSGEKRASLRFEKSPEEQKGVISGVKAGEIITWWDNDNSGKWYTMLDPYKLVIRCE